VVLLPLNAEKKWMVMPRFKAFKAVCTWSGVSASIGIVLLKRHRANEAAIVPKARHKPYVKLYDSAQKRGNSNGASGAATPQRAVYAGVERAGFGKSQNAGG
jgi:hypothetical protein